MKKFLFTVMLIFILGCKTFAANVIPDAVSLNNTNTFGVYQVGHSLVLYSEPNEKSAVKQRIVWSKDEVIPQNLKHVDLFYLHEGSVRRADHPIGCGVCIPHAV